MSSAADNRNRPPSFASVSLPEASGQIITWRAVLVGLAFAILINAWVAYSSYIVNASIMSLAHLPVAAFFPFVVMVLGVNVVLKAVRPAAVFGPTELMVIFFMALTASTVPGWAFTTYIVALIASPYYFATTENRWAVTFHEYLPQWLVARPYDNAMTWFWEGLPENGSIPWGFWVVPLFWWACFFLALFIVGASLAIIFRKQWVEHEKLTFPLMQVPLEMVADADSPGLLPRFANNRLFWSGFGLVFFIIGWNCISYFGSVSPIPLGGTNITIAPSFPPILARLHFLVFGFAFFANLDVLFSIWFFRLLTILQEGMLTRYGFAISDPNAGLSSPTAAQNLGGFFMFVFWGIWVARRHLRDVVRKALTGDPAIDDSHELLSYRKAVFGFVFATIYIVLWLHTAGIAFGVILFLLFCVFTLYLGITRIVSETGIVLLDLPLNAHDFTTSVLGTSNLSKYTLTGLGMTNAFARNWRTLGMVQMAHISKVSHEMWHKEKRHLFLVIAGTLGISMAFSVFFTIYLGYTSTGAYNFGEWGMKGGGQMFYANVVKWINNPSRLAGVDFGFVGMGALVTGMMIYFRRTFAWWPLHPVGLAIASAPATKMAFFSIFLAWLIKVILMKTGGVPLYRETRPFFIGILCAYVVGIALSFVVDLIWFPNQGHGIHAW